VTQVPHFQRPVDVPVVPEESAPEPERPAAASTAPATHPRGLPDDLHNALLSAICETGIPVVAATAVADAIGAHPELLDALVAYRQQEREEVEPAQSGITYPGLDGLPVASLVCDNTGDVAFKASRAVPDAADDDGYRSEWAIAGYTGLFGTRVLEMPVTVLWTPDEAKGER
jgi:hypothetical protein